jgi:sulfur carrier protein
MSRLTAATGLTIHVNDEPRTLAGPATLEALMSELGLAGLQGLAVAVNHSVVPRTAWAAQPLADGDRVLVIRAAQGG